MTGFVYAIQSSDGAVKIGFSTNPRQRFGKVSSDAPHDTRLLGFVPATLEQEQELHQLLAASRRRGEWYEDTPAVRHFLNMLPPAKKPPRKVNNAGGGLMRLWRVQNNISMRELARRAGTSAATISRLEKGSQWPSRDLLRKIVAATGYQVSIDSLALDIARAPR